MWLSFQPFKRHCGNSRRWVLTPPLSQTTTVWARHGGPDKDSGIWRPISRAPLGRPLPDSSFFSHSFQGARNWFLGETTLKLKSGTLAKTKQCHYMSSSSMLSPFIFQMGLIIYVGLLLLTPKVLSLPPDPKDNAFLSWTPSYAAFHNRSNCWVCGTHHPPTPINWRYNIVRFSISRKGLSSLCKNLHQQQPYVTPFLDLMTSNNPKMDWCNYGHNITFNFDYVLTWFNDYFAVYKKVNGSRSGGFLPHIYQIWDEVIWLTPKKGCLLSNAPICWEQIEPSPEASRQLNDNDWKQLGFLPQELCTTIIPVFSNPSSGPPFAWPGTHWDWISQSRWFAPNGASSICGSYLWAWLPLGWTGR